MKDGDVVEVEIREIGVLKNLVIEPKSVSTAFRVIRGSLFWFDIKRSTAYTKRRKVASHSS